MKRFLIRKTVFSLFGMGHFRTCVTRNRWHNTEDKSAFVKR